MNKTDFIKAIAEKTGLSKKDAAAAVAAALETITETIKEDTVSLSGFGTLAASIVWLARARIPAPVRW